MTVSADAGGTVAQKARAAKMGKTRRWRFMQFAPCSEDHRLGSKKSAVAVRIRGRRPMAKIWRSGSVMGREDRVGRRVRGAPASKEAADEAKKGPKVERLRALW